MKKYLLLGCLALAVLVMAIGCSDDDECPNCPEVTQQMVAYGYMQLYDGSLSMYCSVVGLDGLLPDVDSVKVGTELAEMEPYFGMGGGVYEVYYSEDGDMMSKTAWSGGDVVPVTIYTPSGTAQASPVVLEYREDFPHVIGWDTAYPYTDTLALNEAFTLDWHPVELADYYMVTLDYSKDSAGVHVYTYETFVVEDTTYTHAAGLTPYNGYIYVDVYAITGPNYMTSTGNITGAVADGLIASLAYEYFTIYIGTGDPYPSPDITEDPAERQVDLKKVVQRLMNQ